jgi:pimeloyl-ACP methyl ester carboxylesterase
VEAKRSGLLRVIVVPKVKVNDIQIYYEVKGEGFPLVMIQGAGGYLEGWDPRLVEGLSKQFKLVLFDNRGAGRTETSNREYTIRLFADDTAGLMNALGISKAHVLGISMGGAVAQELVLNYPEKVSKLVLCSTYSQWRPTQEQSVLVSDLSMEELIKKVLSLPFASDYPSDFVRKNPLVVFSFTSDFVRENPDLANHLLQPGMEHPPSKENLNRVIDAIFKFNTQGRLQQIKVPTLVLHGKRDVTCYPKDGSFLAEAIPNAKLVYLEKSNHMLAEEMNKVISTITDFLARAQEDKRRNQR